MKLVAAFVLVTAGTLATAQPAPPQATAVSEGVWLIPGSFPAGRNPDGNTIVFRGEQGLVVMDTGRHRWHRDAILDFVARQKLPVTAIINSHWHLDHNSGNVDLKQRWPAAKLYTSHAIDRVVRDFWPEGMKRSQAFLDSGRGPAGVADDIRGDLVTQSQPQFLQPDVPITASGPQRIDGRLLEVNLAPNAASDGDVWVYDPRSGTAAVGDLVTLPVPFLDTACTQGWLDGLAQVDATPFTHLIPGHGPVMDRAQFRSYRLASVAYAACAKSTIDKSQCATDWASATASLRAPEPADDPRALEMAAAYVEMLRANGGNSARCLAR